MCVFPALSMFARLLACCAALHAIQHPDTCSVPHCRPWRLEEPAAEAHEGGVLDGAQPKQPTKLSNRILARNSSLRAVCVNQLRVFNDSNVIRLLRAPARSLWQIVILASPKLTRMSRHALQAAIAEHLFLRIASDPPLHSMLAVSISQLFQHGVTVRLDAVVNMHDFDHHSGHRPATAWDHC